KGISKQRRALPISAKAVKSQTGVTVCHDTIWRKLQRNGVHGYHPRRKPIHKKAHLEFARAHLWVALHPVNNISLYYSGHDWKHKST
uniref:Transposase Tc1-like domain-containing protein n=1 Tax=Oryzias latipes TaxID=8090 RepID=A0A3P9HM53_ORYLA